MFWETEGQIAMPVKDYYVFFMHIFTFYDYGCRDTKKIADTQLLLGVQARSAWNPIVSVMFIIILR